MLPKNGPFDAFFWSNYDGGEPFSTERAASDFNIGNQTVHSYDAQGAYLTSTVDVWFLVD
jgi:hypothetical protein